MLLSAGSTFQRFHHGQVILPPKVHIDWETKEKLSEVLEKLTREIEVRLARSGSTSNTNYLPNVAVFLAVLVGLYLALYLD